MGGNGRALLEDGAIGHVDVEEMHLTVSGDYLSRAGDEKVRVADLRGIVTSLLEATEGEPNAHILRELFVSLEGAFLSVPIPVMNVTLSIHVHILSPLCERFPDHHTIS